MCPNQDTAQFSMAGPALVGKPLTDHVIKVSVGGRANLGVFALRFRHVVGYIGTAEYQHVSLRSEQVYSQPPHHAQVTSPNINQEIVPAWGRSMP